MEIFKTVVGNWAPNMVFTVKRNGVVIDVTNCTVELAIRSEYTGETTNTGHQGCTLTTAASGIVTYVPNVADTPHEGRYIGDVKITYPDTSVERINEQLLIIARAAIS